ncbi:MAG: DUF1565 domain-containing protein [Planctomycetia bacterium]|nr:DUF1565 domain-containing protein [Planctomycetia bacterium]
MPSCRSTSSFCRLALVAFAIFATLAANRQLRAEPALSHAPLRTLPKPSARPPATGSNKYADAARGSDQADGSSGHPWRTINHALTQLRAGDTLNLRGGTYYEQVRCALRGTAEQPIVVRSASGELATIDAGEREFFEQPAQAWEPVAGAGDEYRSTRTFGNIRYLLGSFGDSFIGLNTYYHAQDLRATNEMWDLVSSDDKNGDVKPVYCGPGLWYDPATGRVHARLAHTHLKGTDNYTGSTDPRQVPLVVVPSHHIPLRLDGAAHLTFQDLVVRGGGHDTILLEQTRAIAFDNVTVWCGSNGIRAYGAQGLTLHRCGLFGNVPPWTFRTDTSLRTYPWRNERDITRLNTHALLLPNSGRESDVYAFPQNDDWKISYCEFGDGHDGVYLGGLNVDFHHNLIDGTQDDGIYLSPMYHRYTKTPDRIRIHANVIRRCLTPLAFGGKELTTDVVFVCRNVIDCREPIPTGRPSTAKPEPTFQSGKPLGDHGSPPWSSLWFVNNTLLMRDPARSAEMALTDAAHFERKRYVFNNLFVHTAPLPAPKPTVVGEGISDGNLYWSLGAKGAETSQFFAKFRGSPAFEESKKVYSAGFGAGSRVGDPRLNDDFTLGKGSAAIDAGTVVPAEYVDPLRTFDQGVPDIGALPLGASMFRVGREAAQP